MKLLMKSTGFLKVFAVCASLSSVPAFAHTHLQEATPAKDSTVAEAPATVRLHFSEGLEVSMCKLEVKDSKTGHVVSDGKPTAPEENDLLQVKLKPLKKEKTTYTVIWKAVSKDTHKMEGTYSFTYAPTK